MDNHISLNRRRGTRNDHEMIHMAEITTRITRPWWMITFCTAARLNEVKGAAGWAECFGPKVDVPINLWTRLFAFLQDAGNGLRSGNRRSCLQKARLCGVGKTKEVVFYNTCSVEHHLVGKISFHIMKNLLRMNKSQLWNVSMVLKASEWLSCQVHLNRHF